MYKYDELEYCTDKLEGAMSATTANVVSNPTSESSDIPAAVPHRIYRAGTGVRQKLNALGASIIHRPPYCSGTLSVDPRELVLFYGRSVKAGETVAG